MELSDEFFHDLDITLKISDWFYNKYGINPYDNYKFREFKLASLVKLKLNTRCVLYAGRSGADSHIPELKKDKTEMKTATVKLTKNNKIPINQKMGEWDKQNDQSRRLETLMSDSFIFGLVDRPFADPFFMIFVHNANDVSKIINLLETKQQDFILRENDCINNGKRIPRDTISITINELLKCCDNSDIVYYGEKLTTREFLNKGVLNV